MEKFRVVEDADCGKIKTASYLHRTAQPHTLAIFRSWGSSAGAGRIRLAGCKYKARIIKLRIVNRIKEISERKIFN